MCRVFNKFALKLITVSILLAPIMMLASSLRATTCLGR